MVLLLCVIILWLCMLSRFIMLKVRHLRNNFFDVFRSTMLLISWMWWRTSTARFFLSKKIITSLKISSPCFVWCSVLGKSQFTVSMYIFFVLLLVPTSLWSGTVTLVVLGAVCKLLTQLWLHEILLDSKWCYDPWTMNLANAILVNVLELQFCAR